MSVELIILLMIVVLVLSTIVLVKKRRRTKFLKHIASLSIEQKIIEIEKLKNRKADYNTSHLLHFLVSVLLVGVWVIPWIIIADSNRVHRSRIDKLINSIE